MGKGNFEAHDFYCINCGKKGLILPRKRGRQRTSFHRKKLYCIYCKKEVNMIECKNEFEVKKFLENYEKGAYENEAKESLSYCGSSRLR